MHQRGNAADPKLMLVIFSEALHVNPRLIHISEDDVRVLKESFSFPGDLQLLMGVDKQGNAEDCAIKSSSAACRRLPVLAMV